MAGENKGGKTFLMRFASVLEEKLENIIDSKIRDVTTTDVMEDTSSYIISEDNISEIVEYFNDKLSDMKERLVYELYRSAVV